MPVAFQARQGTAPPPSIDAPEPGKRAREQGKKAVRASKRPHVRRILDETHEDPTGTLPLEPVITRIIALAQALDEKQFYDYQTELSFRLVESLLKHDGEVITILMARQLGKTEVIGALIAACSVILPTLAKEFPNDWHFNITDDKGVYRGYVQGIQVGIYAPKLDQSALTFERIRKAFNTDTSKKILRELNLTFEESNGNTVRLSNGSRILCESASEQSKIEGETHHLLIVEEAQDVGDSKIRKSLHPMTAATMGTIVKVGTATTRKCDFYDSIRHNERLALMGDARNHFFYPYMVGIKSNSMYQKYIEKEKLRLGENSDEFRTSYCGEWIFERGMFTTSRSLFSNFVALTEGLFSVFHLSGLPKPVAYYSIVAGIDWGSSHDSTVVTLMAVNWAEPIESGSFTDYTGNHSYTFYRKHILGWLEFLGDDYEHQFGEIYTHLSMLPRLRKITMDSNACGRPMFDRFTSAFKGRDVEVEPFSFQAKLKSDGFKLFYSDICGRRLTFPASNSVRQDIRYRKFVGQMLDLRKSYANGLMVVSHPEEKGAHDDFCDSGMLACWGASRPAKSNTFDFLAENPFFR